MKNSAVIIVVALILVVGGLGVYAFTNQNASMTKSDSVAQPEVMVKDDEPSRVTTDDVMMQKDVPSGAAANEGMMKKEGKYAAFSPELLANSAATRRVLFFYANWCPTCKPADASFTQNQAQLPADVTVIRVNYNDTETDQAEKELAKKYGVTYQHTFVQIDANGNEVSKWNGGQIEELLNNVQ